MVALPQPGVLLHGQTAALSGISAEVEPLA
jgi:hypothetical protein